MKLNGTLLGIALMLCCLHSQSARSQNQCVSFDGINDYIDMTNSSVHRVSPRLTIEAWIKPSSTGNVVYAAIANNIWHTVGQQGGYGLLMSGSTSIYFVVTVAGSGIQYLSGSIGSSGVWKHVAGTFDSTMMRLYVNGTQVESLAVAGEISYAYTNNFRVGLYYDDGAGGDVYYYKGLIDEVRVWNVVRTQSQLQQYDSTELNGDETGLVGYWKLNEGSGTVTQDGTANDKDGTIFEATWAGETGMPVELTSLTATVRGRCVELAWKTATETNNHGFAVERNTLNNEQLPMNNWKQIGFVEGAGNSNAPKEYSFTDNVPVSGRYQYRLKQVDNDGSFEYSTAVEVRTGSPAGRYELAQNHPNPFNPTTSIAYALAKDEFVTLKVYDMIGKEIATLVNGKQSAGAYAVPFDASSYPSGIYFYMLRAGNSVETKKMLLVK